MIAGRYVESKQQLSDEVKYVKRAQKATHHDSKKQLRMWTANYGDPFSASEENLPS